MNTLVNDAVEAAVTQTIEGVNVLFADQKATPGCPLPATLPGGIADLPALGSADNPYSVGGATALFDAAGVTIAGTEKWVANNTWFATVVVPWLGKRMANWHEEDDGPSVPTD